MRQHYRIVYCTVNKHSSFIYIMSKIINKQIYSFIKFKLLFCLISRQKLQKFTSKIKTNKNCLNSEAGTWSKWLMDYQDSSQLLLLIISLLIDKSSNCSSWQNWESWQLPRPLEASQSSSLLCCKSFYLIHCTFVCGYFNHHKIIS